jgi:hypothetical protein
MRNKQVYLHLGTQKTGTTSIQGYLNHNREKFRQCNVSVFTPDADKGVSEAHKLRNIIELIQEMARTGARHWGDSQRQLLNASLTCIKESATDNIILSEELFWNAICTPGKRSLLSEFIDGLEAFAEIKVVVYLRRQDLFLMSLYQQRLRGGKMNGKTCQRWIASFIESPNVISNYEENLRYLLSRFSKDSIAVRPFETGQLREQSLFADFMNCVDQKITDEFEVPNTRRNPGLSPALAEIIRILGIYHHTREAIIPFLDSANKNNTQLFNQNRQHDYLSPQQRIDILERYRSGNQWIAREFLGRQNGILFQDPLPDTSKPWEKFRLDPDEVRRIFSEVDFLDGRHKAAMQKQVLSALAHPMKANSIRRLREMRQNIRLVLKSYYSRLKKASPINW